MIVQAEVFLLLAFAVALAVAFVVGMFAGIALGRARARVACEREIARTRQAAEKRIKDAAAHRHAHLRAGIQPPEAWHG